MKSRDYSFIRSGKRQGMQFYYFTKDNVISYNYVFLKWGFNTSNQKGF